MVLSSRSRHIINLLNAPLLSAEHPIGMASCGVSITAIVIPWAGHVIPVGHPSSLARAHLPHRILSLDHAAFRVLMVRPWFFCTFMDALHGPTPKRLRFLIQPTFTHLLSWSRLLRPICKIYSWTLTDRLLARSLVRVGGFVVARTRQVVVNDISRGFTSAAHGVALLAQARFVLVHSRARHILGILVDQRVSELDGRTDLGQPTLQILTAGSWVPGTLSDIEPSPSPRSKFPLWTRPLHFSLRLVLIPWSQFECPAFRFVQSVDFTKEIWWFSFDGAVKNFFLAIIHNFIPVLVQNSVPVWYFNKIRFVCRKCRLYFMRTRSWSLFNWAVNIAFHSKRFTCAFTIFFYYIINWSGIIIEVFLFYSQSIRLIGTT